MKVKDLIEELEKMPENAEVRVGEESGCFEHPILGIVEEAGDVRIEYREDEE